MKIKILFLFILGCLIHNSASNAVILKRNPTNRKGINEITSLFNMAWAINAAQYFPYCSYPDPTSPESAEYPYGVQTDASGLYFEASTVNAKLSPGVDSEDYILLFDTAKNDVNEIINDPSFIEFSAINKLRLEKALNLISTSAKKRTKKVSDLKKLQAKNPKFVDAYKLNQEMSTAVNGYKSALYRLKCKNDAISSNQ